MKALQLKQKLSFIGVHNHWRVYKDPLSPSSFWFMQSSPELLFNCMYEVQFVKASFPESDYFGQEYIFYHKDNPVGMAVKVSRPTMTLRQLLDLWLAPNEDPFA
jgi:hypothetical protein